jgi:hypothetical protein
MASSRTLLCMFLMLIIGNLQTDATDQVSSVIDLTEAAPAPGWGKY